MKVGRACDFIWSGSKTSGVEQGKGREEEGNRRGGRRARKSVSDKDKLSARPSADNPSDPAVASAQQMRGQALGPWVCGWPSESVTATGRYTH